MRLNFKTNITLEYVTQSEPPTVQTSSLKEFMIWIEKQMDEGNLLAGTEKRNTVAVKEEDYFNLRIPCAGNVDLSEKCDQSVGIPFALLQDVDTLTKIMSKQGWFVSICSDSDDDPSHSAFSLICEKCARRLLPPKVFAEAMKNRARTLQ